MCFVDFERAFDEVKHDQLIDILRKTGLECIRCSRNLYRHEFAQIRTNDFTPKYVAICKGVSQGFSLLLNSNIKRNWRSTDNSVLIADNIQELQQMIEKLN